jgi:hypothetical protein
MTSSHLTKIQLYQRNCSAFSRTTLAVPGLAAVLLAGCAVTDDTAVSELQNAASAIESAGPKTSGGQALARTYQDLLRVRGSIDKASALKLTAFLKGQEQAEAKAILQQIVADSTSKLSTEARTAMGDALAGKVVGDVPLDNAVYRIALGKTASGVGDDELYIKGNGTLQSNTGISGHSRGYAKKADGVLRGAHGSTMPTHRGFGDGAAELPPVALDAAVKGFGVNLSYSFDAMSKTHFDPKAQYWEGICHAWTYSSLDERLNVLIDSEGPAGKRGLWFFGHWMSRADLGNWMMGVSNQLSVTDADLVSAYVTPDALFKGIAEWVMTGRKGLRADLFNDVEQGGAEVWNQPIVAANISLEGVAPAARDAVIAYAKSKSPMLPAIADIKLARIGADWGAEVSDNHEEGVALRRIQWNMYLATEASGRVVGAYMAHHVAAKIPVSITLPLRTSDALPDYFAYPKHELVDAALAGKPSQLLDNAFEGPHFRFFVSTVLARGIPDATREAFETQVLASATPDAALLRVRFPGIANAYSEQQWKTSFATKLGAGQSFGAVWGMASAEFPKSLLKK